MPYLIDSDVLIDISRGKRAAREYVDALTEAWAISQVSTLVTRNRRHFDMIKGLRLQIPNY